MNATGVMVVMLNAVRRNKCQKERFPGLGLFAESVDLVIQFSRVLFIDGRIQPGCSHPFLAADVGFE